MKATRERKDKSKRDKDRSKRANDPEFDVEINEDDMDIATDLGNTEEYFNGSNQEAEKTETNGPHDLFSEGVDDIQEKRAAKRLSGFEKIVKSLQSGALMTDLVYRSLETLNEVLLKYLKHPTSESERLSCCKIISILALVVGPDADGFVGYYSTPLIRIICDNEYNENTRCESLKCLGMVALICSNQLTMDIWQLVQSLAMNSNTTIVISDIIQVTAMEVWCLLSTLQPIDSLLEVCKQGVFQSMVDLLTNGNSEVKIISSQCIALLLEYGVAYYNHEDKSNEEYSLLLNDNTDDLNHIIDMLKHICKDGNKQISKREKKERKSALRIVLDYLVDQISPYESISMTGADVEMESFQKILIFNYLLYTLKGGIQSSTITYPVVTQLLDIKHVSSDGVISGKGLSSRVSKNSAEGKKRSNNRRQERGQRDQSRGGGGSYGYDDDL